jgi:hypothetical protein
MPTIPSPSSAQQLALFQGLVQEAAAGGDLLMGKLCAAARIMLQSREAGSRDVRERDRLGEAAHQLRNREGLLCKAFPQTLRKAFAGSAEIRKATVAALAEVQFDQLELMDESEVLTSVALARIQQVAMQCAEASLAELNTLISSAQGLGAVRPERNPLRPDVYVSALKEAVEQIPVSVEMRVDWLGAMSASLGKELCALYVRWAADLRKQGVAAAGYAVVGATQTLPHGVGRGVAQEARGGRGLGQAAMPTARPTASAPTAGALAKAAAPASLPAKDDALLTLDKLRRLLSGELDSGVLGSTPRVQAFAQQFARQFEAGSAASPAAQTDFDATVPAALEALTEMKQVDRVVQRLEKRLKSSAGSAASSDSSIDAVRARLRNSTSGVAQALSLEVVTLMVENMSRDPRLLHTMQRLVRGLEPALLRLALVDPRFFTDKQHSARALLQEITHRSLAYVSEESSGFSEFVQQIERALAPLGTVAIESAEPFEKALAHLRAGWTRTEKKNERARRDAVEALKHAEARNLLAEKIARAVEAHPDSAGVPAVVTEFLCGPWAQVIAQARLASKSDGVRADRYQALISELLWSVHPELASKNSGRLTRLVPPLLTTLREGLEIINYPSLKTSAFFEALMGLHQLAFRGARKPAQQPSLLAGPSEPPTTPSPASEPPVRSRWVEEGNPWVAPEEARASNFMEMPEPTAVVPPSPVQPLLPDDLIVDVAATAMEELPLGSWVELLQNDAWARIQLTWASPHGTLFLFTNAFGSTQSMTRRLRDKLVESGKLRVISGQAVVDGALDAVAQVAMQNSVDTVL